MRSQLCWLEPLASTYLRFERLHIHRLASCGRRQAAGPSRGKQDHETRAGERQHAYGCAMLASALGIDGICELRGVKYF